MKIRHLLLAGFTAPPIYLATVILGGALRADYSHVGNAISELLLNGAPNKALLDILFVIYNFLCLFGSVGFLRLTANHPYSSWKMTVSGICLMVVSIAGIFMTVFFPQDPRGSTPTFAGTMHLVTAGIESLGLMTAMLLIGLHFLKVNPLEEFGTSTLWMLGLVFISGGAAAVFISSPYMGVLERVTIGTSLLWQAILYWKLIQMNP